MTASLRVKKWDKDFRMRKFGKSWKVAVVEFENFYFFRFDEKCFPPNIFYLYKRRQTYQKCSILRTNNIEEVLHKARWSTNVTKEKIVWNIWNIWYCLSYRCYILLILRYWYCAQTTKNNFDRRACALLPSETPVHNNRHDLTPDQNIPENKCVLSRILFLVYFLFSAFVLCCSSCFFFCLLRVLSCLLSVFSRFSSIFSCS